MAVKVLASHLSEDERARQRFQREARAAAGPLLAPERRDDLRRRRARRARLHRHGADARRHASPTCCGAATGIEHQRALRWLREAAAGARRRARRRRRAPRRQARPTCCSTTATGSAIGDFGIARLAWEDQVTQTGQVLGTAAYLSPEQAMGEPATAASDRYALAVVAFELLTGETPVPGRALRRPGARPRRGRPAARLRARPGPVRARRRRARPRHGQGPRRPLGHRRRVRRAPRRGARRAAAAARRRPPPPARRRHAQAATRDRTPPPPPRPAAPRRRRRGRPAALGPGHRRRCSPRSSAALLIVVLGVLLLQRRRRRRRQPGRGPQHADADGGEEGDADARRPRRPRRADADADRHRDADARRTPDARRRRARRGSDPSQLQLQAFNLNNGRQVRARRCRSPSRRSSGLQGNAPVSPCGYALYELARAQRGTGDPDGRDPDARGAPATATRDDQRATVDAQELQGRAREGRGRSS